MKKLLLALLSLLLLATAAACGGGNKINGKTPDQVAFEWFQADVKADDGCSYKMLSEDAKKKHGRMFDKNYHGEKGRKITDYQLIEWKYNDDIYVYEIEFIDPRDQHLMKEYTKIIRTEDGWKVDSIQMREGEIDPYRIDQPKFIKEMGRHE